MTWLAYLHQISSTMYKGCVLIMNSSVVHYLLIILMHTAIQVVYHHYMLVSFVNVCGMLNFDTFVLSKNISQQNEQPKDKQWR